MSCTQDSMAMVRPGRARVLVTELNESDQINPTPAAYEDSDRLVVEHYLSPTKLKSLSATEDLSQVTSLEICVDTRENTLHDFGAYLPRLEQLKMNNSTIMSVRDLGISLPHLQALWMSRCGLVDLDGIPSFSSLKELHVAYNSVSDLSQVAMLENLQVLDVEGNEVDDLLQVYYLGLCSRLATLTLEGNPVCLRPRPNDPQTEEEVYCYRSAVRCLLPQLRYLDGVRAEEEEAGPGLLRESVKDVDASSPSETAHASRSTVGPGQIHSPVDERAASVSRASPAQRAPTSPAQRPPTSPAQRPPTSPAQRAPTSPAQRPPTSPAQRPPTSPAQRAPTSPAQLPPTSLSCFRPASCSALSPRGPRCGSAMSYAAPEDPGVSLLIHGAGKIVFCGNGVQALRARRRKMNTAASAPVFAAASAPPCHVPEHTFDLEEEEDGRERVDVIAEFRAWREQRNILLLAMERERRPQVLTVLSDDDEEENEEESLSIAIGEEEGEEEAEGKSHWANPASPDSSFQSPSPDLLHRAAVSPEVARLSLSPDSTLSPSPPTCATAAPAGRRVSELRARRLRLPQTGVRPAGEAAGASSVGADVQTFQVAARPRVPRRPQTAHLAPRPASTPVGHAGVRAPWREVGVSAVSSVNGHQPITSRGAPERLAIMRPRTARAVLQKPPQCRTLTHMCSTTGENV